MWLFAKGRLDRLHEAIGRRSLPYRGVNGAA
jgi:hypothetical protein